MQKKIFDTPQLRKVFILLANLFRFPGSHFGNLSILVINGNFFIRHENIGKVIKNKNSLP